MKMEFSIVSQKFLVVAPESQGEIFVCLTSLWDIEAIKRNLNYTILSNEASG